MVSACYAATARHPGPVEPQLLDLFFALDISPSLSLSPVSPGMFTTRREQDPVKPGRLFLASPCPLGAPFLPCEQVLRWSKLLPFVLVTQNFLYYMESNFSAISQPDIL